MSTQRISYLALFVVFLLSFAHVAYSSEVVVEFLYWNPRTDTRYCDTCPSWVALYNDFLQKNETITRIGEDYAKKAVFAWTDLTSNAGITAKQRYKVSSPNSLVINGTTKIEGNFNETYIRQSIDAVLEGSSPNPSSTHFLAAIIMAFSFGFFETFSPCLLALLSFLLSFTIGKTTQFRQSFMQIMLFGIGFIVAAVLVGVSFGLLFLSMQALQFALTTMVCVFALFFGFNLLGLFKIPLESKPILQNLARKYVFTSGGMILLGFLFYFLDPCIAPFFFAMLPILSIEALPVAILFFCLGVIVPFLLIAVVAGNISKLVRIAFKKKTKIRFLSGLILVVYTLYVIFFRLL